LITRYKLREATKAEGAANLADIEEHAEGLICLTGGAEGPLTAALARGGFEEALREVERPRTYSALKMFMWNCSGTSTAARNIAIKRRFELRVP
jgi:hypothetical protein